MSDTVLARLAEFAPTDKTPRLVSAVFSVVPGVPPMVHYPALPTVVAALGGTGADMARVSPHLDDDAVKDILWMSSLVDTGDKGYAVFTGVTSALKVFFGSGSKAAAMDTDAQQRNDAVLKAIALAYLAWKATPGSILRFPELPAGRALLTWYAAMEIALPFADNAAVAGGTIFSDLMNRYGADQMGRFSSMLGGKAADGVQAALTGLTGPIQGAIATVAPYASKIATTAKEYLPAALTTADTAAGVLAGAADVMPVYRYLGGRLAAEAVVATALMK